MVNSIDEERAMNTKAKNIKESDASLHSIGKAQETAKTDPKPEIVAKRHEAPIDAAAENKPRKIKMVRDSFTMPERDYSQLDALKKKCLRAGVHVKKSELLRAGLLSLAKLPDTALIKAVGAVEKLKTGRPAKT